MRGDGVIDGIPAQEIAPKGVRLDAVKVRGGGLLNRGEDVGRRGGPQLGQARGAVVFVLSCELLCLVRAAPCFALALRGRRALLSLRIVSARGQCTAGCRQRFAGDSPFPGPR